MSEKRTKHHLKADWRAKKGGARDCDENLIEIARFLARRAAERDFKSRQGIDS